MNPAPFSFEIMLSQLSALPLWVKQVIYAQLRLDLENLLSKNTLDAFGPDDTLQLLHPQLTVNGQRELRQPARKEVSPALLKLLYLADKNKSVIDICIINQWNLEQCSLYLLEALEKEYIIQPASGIIQATIYYLAGRIRLGEYLLKIGRLSLEQLDQALRTQRYIEESLGERTGIGNVLINLGYINKQDSEGILFLKEESRKHFTLDSLGVLSYGGDNAMADLQNKLYQAYERVRQLEAQNHYLKQSSPGGQ